MLNRISGTGSNFMRQYDSPQVGCMNNPAAWGYYALSFNSAGPSCESIDANMHSSTFVEDQSKRLVQVPSGNHACSRKQRGQPTGPTAPALVLPKNTKAHVIHSKPARCGMPVLRWGLRKVLCMHQGCSGVR